MCWFIRCACAGPERSPAIRRRRQAEPFNRSPGEFNLRGFAVRDLRALLPHLTGPQISRLIKRLRMHRLVKKVHGTYRYYLTRAGRRATAAALQLREACIIPALAHAA